MNGFFMGDRVVFSRRLRRRTHYEANRHVKQWEVSSWHLHQQDTEGVVVGYRSISNGYTSYIGGDTAWVQQSRITVFLIAYDPWKAPVYVLPEHVRASDV